MAVFAPVTLTLTDDLDVRTSPRYSEDSLRVSTKINFLRQVFRKYE